MDKTFHNPSHKNFRLKSQIPLRVLAIATTLASAWMTFANKQSAVIFGVKEDARYSYSPTFKFFAIANILSCAFSLVALLASLMYIGTKAVKPAHCFCFFLHDLVITILLISGCAAATAIGYVAKFGFQKVGWQPICVYFGKFCNISTIAAVFSYLGFFLSLVLTISSAHMLTV